MLDKKDLSKIENIFESQLKGIDLRLEHLYQRLGFLEKESRANREEIKKLDVKMTRFEKTLKQTEKNLQNSINRTIEVFDLDIKNLESRVGTIEHKASFSSI